MYSSFRIWTFCHCLHFIKGVFSCWSITSVNNSKK